jgi:signal transduction histidine kinase
VNFLLEETSSREGLIENEAFSELVTFVRSSLEWGVQRIAAARERKVKASQKDFKSRGRKASDEVRDLLETIKQETSTSGTPTNTVSVPTAALEMVVDKVGRVVEELEEEKKQSENAHLHYEEMLRILASLGTSIAVFSHEIRGALNGFSGALLRLQRLAEQHGFADEASSPLNDASGSQGRLKDLASYVMSLVAHTANREKTEVALQGELHAFINQFKQYLNTHEVEFEIAVTPPYLRTSPIHQSEIHSVLFNFLTNSIKAMLRANPEKRKIRISAEREGKFVRIGFQDTGDGVPEAIADRVFDPFFTTHQHGDDGLAGPGSGLGLKIVHDIASANGGDVRLAPPDAGYNCRFDFYLPVSSSQK